MKAGNIPDNYPLGEFVPRFINAEFDTKFGSWSDNVLSWLTLRGNSDSFLLLRYEEMKQALVGARVELTALSVPNETEAKDLYDAEMKLLASGERP